MNLQVEIKSVEIQKKEILKDIKFEIQSSKVTIAIGPNGAGKSTLLKAISKIIHYKGQITLDDVVIGELSHSEISKMISLMSQFNENVHLSVLEILELGRRPHSGFDLLSEDIDIINNIVQEFELEGFLHRDISTLSGGERQKVYLATALIRNPKVLLLDEPISHLDPKNQQEILEIVKSVTKKRDICTIIVLHDLQNALHYGDEILMLKNGNLQNYLNINEISDEHLGNLYDIKCKIFKNEGHPFVLLGHHHFEHKKLNHNH